MKDLVARTVRSVDCNELKRPLIPLPSVNVGWLSENKIFHESHHRCFLSRGSCYLQIFWFHI